VWVANARKLRLIYENKRKNDRVDAMYLARIARVDPLLLSPIEHRGEEAQTDLGVLQARETLVRCRTRLINHCRGQVKIFGFRLPACSGASFHHKVPDHVPEQCQSSLGSIIEQIGSLTQKIRVYDGQVYRLCNEKYPQTARLMQIRGVGHITALAFVLVIDDPMRFARSRDVGAYLGMCPGQRQSGNRDTQLRITKEGNRYVRCLLVQCAHYMLGHLGEDCDLRSKGEALIARGGRGARKKAAVAVARKLAVLMHVLWSGGDVYDPFYGVEREVERPEAPAVA
jgi:transposase